ncbi:hypothetical protein ABIE62_000896 [Porphyrobacter sp. MBR-155]|jgi:hypothetical protein|uniref:hypothetical protein n=1 Tax=Porphyrobacter sp. MBR-155 TaxID=3156464 RepID=UPI003391E682
MTINLKAAFRDTHAFIEDAEPDMDTRVATPPSASAQDFAFGKSVWEVVDGNPDGASVSGVAGISLIGDDEADARGRKKDDDRDGFGWDDLADLQREQREARERAIIENGRITMYGMTVAEEDMDEAISQTLNNFDADAAKFGLEGKDKADYHYWLLVYQNAPDGSPQKAQALEQMGAINEGMTVHILSEADRIGRARTSAPSLTEASDATIANIEDISVRGDALVASGYDEQTAQELASTNLSGGTDSMAFLDGERAGPVISAAYNSSASGEQQFAQTPAPAEPMRQSNFEVGLG